MRGHRFVGFGFGPIQSGLFVKEAFAGGNFDRIVVAEIDQKLVEAVRANKGSYYVNVAGREGVEVSKIDNVEILNPNVPADRQEILDALAEATEIVTSLPSVNFYDMGANGVASLIAEGLKASKAAGVIIYTAENHNHAAEILQETIEKKIGRVDAKRVQFLNTVIGKMSQVVTSEEEIAQLRLKAMTPAIGRAFLVEEFNKILVTRTKLAAFRPGIEVFIEKDDLLPFEEAKLYGHNAIHALLAYLGAAKSYAKMTELGADAAIMKIGRGAFLKESGGALVKKYAALGDELFTEAGYREYAEDLLTRMTNPYLTDTIERAGRDPVRKLSFTDRIFGTMRLALEFGIRPENMALGALAGIGALLARSEENKLPAELRYGDWKKIDKTQIGQVINWLWQGKTDKFGGEIVRLVQGAQGRLARFVGT